jgi:hypothetical protein
MSSSTPNDPITPVPAPWRLKGTVYTFLTYTSSKGAAELGSMKAFIYSPLEAQSSFASGKFAGGIGMVQIIRYTDTPVGPYDEMLLAPGSFRYRTGGSSGSAQSTKEQKNARVTRIYVSHKQTCWNGRKSKVFQFTRSELLIRALLIYISRLEYTKASSSLSF